MTMYERHQLSSGANRFRSDADWYVVGKLADVHMLRVGANGERAVELMHTLAAHLPQEVSVAIESVRDACAWTGTCCSRNDVRDVLARLKLLLSSYGGIEFAIHASDDQLTLTPEMELVVYSRANVWANRLAAMGLDLRDAMPPAVWKPNRHSLAPAAELGEAIATAVERLGLAPAGLDIVGP